MVTQPVSSSASEIAVIPQNEIPGEIEAADQSLASRVAFRSKDEVLAELMAEHIALKKSLGEL
jgi:hypothetical protein